MGFIPCKNFGGCWISHFCIVNLEFINRWALHGWRETHHGFRAWIIPASWDWQKNSKNLVSLLAEFLFLPCPIRAANAIVPLFFLGALSDLCG